MILDFGRTRAGRRTGQDRAILGSFMVSSVCAMSGKRDDKSSKIFRNRG
jgi:hypothetical protein